MEEVKRENEIASGNPLLMPTKDTETKRRSVSRSKFEPLVAYTTLDGTTMLYSGIRLGARRIKARRSLSMYAVLLLMQLLAYANYF